MHYPRHYMLLNDRICSDFFVFHIRNIRYVESIYRVAMVWKAFQLCLNHTIVRDITTLEINDASAKNKTDTKVFISN